MRSHDGKVFAQNDVGVGEVFSGFEEGADGEAGAPEAVGMTLGKSGFAGENLDEENVRDRAGHADHELTESTGSALAKMRGKKTEVF